MSRLLLSLVASALLATACSPSEEPTLPVRPGQETQVCLPASVRFGRKTFFCEVDGAPASGSLSAALVRSGDRLPDTAYSLSTVDARNALVVPAEVHFAEGETSADFSVEYTLSLQPEQSYSASLTTCAAPDSARAVMELVFTRPSRWEDAGSGSYRSGNVLRRVAVKVRRSKDVTEYELADRDFVRRFMVLADGTVAVPEQVAETDGFERVTDSSNWPDEVFKARFPIYGVPGAYDADLHCWLLNLTYYSASADPEPRCDIVRLDSDPDPRWEYAGEAIFTDGWLSQAVSFEARPPLVPEDNPWIVEMQRFRADPKLFRAVGLYRVASPLSPLNGHKSLTVIPIATNPAAGTATVQPVFSGFDCPGLFSAPFTIGGAGKYEGDADGNALITIESPLHNAYGTYGSSWATAHDAVFSIKFEN